MEENLSTEKGCYVCNQNWYQAKACMNKDNPRGYVWGECGSMGTVKTFFFTVDTKFKWKTILRYINIHQ